MQRKGVLYFGLMGVLALLSICGIVAFFKNRKNNYWWGFFVLLGAFVFGLGVKLLKQRMAKSYEK